MILDFLWWIVKNVKQIPRKLWQILKFLYDVVYFLIVPEKLRQRIRMWWRS